MKVTAYGQTDAGLVRRTNQDCYHIDVRRGLFIVADGMGGHAAGEVASSMAVSAVREKLEAALTGLNPADDLMPVLAGAVAAANQLVIQAAADQPAWNGMGTTLTVLLIRAQQALLAHVGDSRLYRWRNQGLEQLSIDHTLVEEQLHRGIISDKEANQSSLSNILLQAVGISAELDICQKNLPVQRGDCFLLCSDGLSDMLREQEISYIMAHSPRPEQVCKQLLEAALAAGGKDNITAVLVSVGT